MHKLWYYVIQVTEYIMAGLFINSGIGVLTPDTLPAENGFLGYLVGRNAVIIYGVSWVAAGIMLIIAKLFHKRHWHGWTLLFMYLTGVYVIILSIRIDGFHLWTVIDIVLVAMLGALYLRWKYVLPDLESHP